MGERDWLAERFEEHRVHLRAVAYRMLGSLSDADDAVQEAWLRLSREDRSDVENLGGWLQAESTVPDADLDTQRRIVDAFVAAARDGDLERLLEVLDPDVVLRVDFGPAGGSREVRGTLAVADNAAAFAGMGLAVQPVLINGVPGMVTFLEGQPFSIGAATVRGGRIVELDILADPERLRQLDLSILEE